MTTFTWSFPTFDVAKSEDGLTDVVKTIHWRYDAVDEGFSAGAYGCIDLGEPDPSSFVPYAEITEEWAIACVTAQVNLGEMNAALDKQIEDQKNPSVAPMVPPFAALEAN